MAATAMKMKQAGLVHKPIIVFPNHLLEQFAREFQQIYPNAKLLVASKEDFTKERRKHLTAKIASGDWDAIITTHSSFERIGMSRDYQEKFLLDQIAEYDELLREHAASKNSNRNLIKTLEKQKAARAEKLKDLLAEDKKDTGLVFDDLGVDHIMVDECFTYDTLIQTDRGLLKIGDIVTNRLTVKVKSVNSSTHAVEWKPVINWFANKRRHKLIEVFHETGSFICTSKHKIWVDGHGYKAAGKLDSSDTLLSLSHQDLRNLPSAIQLSQRRPSQRCEEAETFLLRDLQNECTMGKPRIGSEVQEIHAENLGQPAHERKAKSQGICLDESQQSHEISRNTAETVQYFESERAQAPHTRGQRPSIGTAEVTCGKDGNAYGVCHKHPTNTAHDGKASELLQGRLGRPEEQACSGNRWEHSQQSDSESKGREERQSPIPSGVVRVAVLEPGSDGEYRFGDRDHSVVYDIEVADNHNYFANGVLVSNCQAFKNLETPTKMDRVAGIQSGGSERAFDMYMKCQYLHEKHPGHGVTFATGTPISNSLCEMYTLQRYLDPEGLKSRGIDHFDAWAATFGEVVESMEISPDGKTLKPRSRFSRFVNLPELQQMFRSFADVQTSEMLNLPVPLLETGKPIIVSCPMSDDQAEQQQKLVDRYERLRSTKVDPREDNALKITTDGRKLALDARLLSSTSLTPLTSKLDLMIDIIAAKWRDTQNAKTTQMIFCDMGVNPTPWGFSVYDQIIQKLVAQGIPRQEIATIGEADSDAKKRVLFEKVRSGQVRILLGSTTKMGTGTNVQKRLVALHELDAPWKPAEVEQREGRILRQGNANEEVAIYRYVTEGSFDAFMWQALETKARFISQIMTGESGVRRAEDIGGQELSYAEVKAIASGNPAVLTLAETDAELQRLSILKRNYHDEQFLARRNVRDLPDQIKRMKDRVAALTADMNTITAHADDPVVVGRRSAAREDAVDILGPSLDSLPQHVSQTRHIALGTYRGLRFGIIAHPAYSPEAYLEGATTRTTQLSREHQGPRAVLNAVERLANGYNADCDRARQDLSIAEAQLRDFKAKIGKPFLLEGYLTELATLRDQLKNALSGAPKEGEPTSAELAEKIKTLRAGQTVEAAPQRTGKRQSSAETPVTTRIRRKTEEVVEEPEAMKHLERVARQERPANGRG